MSSAGKTIAVTGAARGIGQAIAQELASQGARVVLGDLDGGQAAEAAAEIGRGAAGVELDVTDTASFRAFLDAAGPIDVLVNNAGIMWVGPFADEPEDVALRQMDVNFHGVVRGMKLALPAMRERGCGQIVNIASAASKIGSPGEATYAATKHAVYGYSMLVREELRGSGVDIAVVMPVVVETELAAGTSEGKGKRLTPRDVAVATAEVMGTSRFEVYVPRSTGAWARVTLSAPQRVRDALYRAMVPNQLELGDPAAREDYERKAVGA